MSTIRVACVSLAAVVSMMSRAFCQDSVTDTDTQAVLTGIRAHCQKVMGIEVETQGQVTKGGTLNHTYKETDRIEMQLERPGVPSRFVSDKVSREQMTYEWPDTGQRFTQWEDIRRAWAFDGRVGTMLQVHEKNKGSGATISAHPDPIGGMWISSFLPVYDWSLDEFLASARVAGRAQYGGASVLVVEAYHGSAGAAKKPHNTRFYVDPGRDFAMVCREGLLDTGEVSSRLDVKELFLWAGIWLPAKAVSTTFYPDGQAVINEASIKYIRLNPRFSAADFRLDFPDETYVRDTIAGIEYTVRKDTTLTQTLGIWRMAALQVKHISLPVILLRVAQAAP